jgi:hypothetical protein
MKPITAASLGILLTLASPAASQTDPRFGRWISVMGGDPSWADGLVIVRNLPGRLSASNEHVAITAKDGSDLPLGVFISAHEAVFFDKNRRTDRPVLTNQSMVIDAAARYLTELGFDMSRFTEVTLVGRESMDSAFQNGKIGVNFKKRVHGFQSSWESAYIGIDPVSGKAVDMTELGLRNVTYASIDGVMSEAAAIARAKEIARAYYRNNGTAARKSDPDQPAKIGLGYGVYGGDFGSEVSIQDAIERTHKPLIYTVTFGFTMVTIDAKTGENLGGGIMHGLSSPSDGSPPRPAAPKPIPFSWKGSGGARRATEAKQADAPGGGTHPLAMIGTIAAVGSVSLGVAAIRRHRRRR